MSGIKGEMAYGLCALLGGLVSGMLYHGPRVHQVEQTVCPNNAIGAWPVSFQSQMSTSERALKIATARETPEILATADGYVVIITGDIARFVAKVILDLTTTEETQPKGARAR